MTIDNDTLARDYALLEDQHDILAAQLARMESANHETTPGDVIHRLCDGANPVQVWREHRALTQEQLATASGVSLAMIQAIESGAELTLRIAAVIAKVLRKDAEDLIPWSQDDTPE